MTHSNETARTSILVLAEASDRWFSSPEAVAEILYLEGINDVETARLDALSPALIAGRSLVVVGPADPSPDAVGMLLEHARGGGGLIAFAPGEAFAKQLGLLPRLKGILNARLPAPIDGFPEATLPIRGWSQLYESGKPAEAREVAPLLSSAGTPAGGPAALEIPIGSGRVLVLAYDPISCIYLIRQGNPLLAGCRSSGFSRMRPSDLFDNWGDSGDMGLPVADLHAHFLRELVHQAWPKETVMPWWWYFPGNVDTALLLTSDDDWSSREHFETLIGACEECGARLTFYIVREQQPSGPSSVMDRAWLEELEQRGFDFSIHPDLPPPTRPLWEKRLADHVRQFEAAYGRRPSSSVRNHCITWSGYLEGAQIESRIGFAVDANTFSLLPSGRYYMNGAGLPLRFAGLRGDVLPIEQLPTQFSDETTLGGQGFKWSLNLAPEAGVALVTRLMRENASFHHSLMCVNSHPVSFATYSAPLWRPVLEFAREESIPVWHVDHFHRFWQARRQVRLTPVPRGQAAAGPILAEGDLATARSQGLTAMIPGETGPGGKGRTLGGRTFTCRSF
ncbi:MAG: hypothetical protein HYU36_17055 [Planctomycetes bacterium]|nr:hypothetical protein [Planctomycetota bacterium]